MKKSYSIIQGLVFFCILYCGAGLYVSPGIQIGFNSNQGFFYGYQISVGVFSSSMEAGIPVGFVPAISTGVKKYHKTKNRETYTDLQLTYSMFHTPNLGIPAGIGFGKINKENLSSYRIKTFFWLYSNYCFDFELENKSYNITAIPTLPISSAALKDF
ncbi:uncharacterized protein METZ01_LOCUS486997 [marine metagenome]|uniref:Outer membrane protein beta-barrel domain-containing protein n=1 Tax=marine metagenome TaxID=408172 RepID=A0A383CQ21_9ZZZZ